MSRFGVSNEWLVRWLLGKFLVTGFKDVNGESRRGTYGERGQIYLFGSVRILPTSLSMVSMHHVSSSPMLFSPFPGPTKIPSSCTVHSRSPTSTSPSLNIHLCSVT